MQVQVLYFGMLKDLLQRDRDVVQLPQSACVRTLLDTVRQTGPDCPKLFDSLAVAVNREYATADSQLYEGDEVAFLPPVSGGSGRREPGGMGELA